MLLYNVPGRTVADMANETVLRLAQVPGIIGTKEATGDMARLGALMRDLPEDFMVISGDDPTAAALILLGGKGNISVTANVAPRLMSTLCQAALDGDVAKVRKYNGMLADLNRQLFVDVSGDAATAAKMIVMRGNVNRQVIVDANPIPIKWSLEEMGRIQLGYLLPIAQLNTSHFCQRPFYGNRISLDKQLAEMGRIQ